MGRPLPPEIRIVQREHEVILGMPGPWAENILECSDQYTTKIGGLPDWPMPSEEVNGDLLKCGICGGFLVLVAQIYAPLTISAIKMDERTIYIFGCPSSSCGISPLSWRTLRVQKVNNTVSRNLQARPQGSLSVSEASSSPPCDAHEEDVCDAERISSEAEQQGEADGNDWWEDDSWQPIMERSDEEDVDFFELEELGRALFEVGHGAATNSERTHSDIVYDEEGEINEHENSSWNERLDPEFPVLPCFYIYSQTESSPSGERMALEAAEVLESRVDGSTDCAEETWEGEEYEHDRALSVDRTYLKFKKKLDCYPEQCFRYCFGGRPLWANNDRGESGFCSLCGGPRIYELQLMPPVLYYLQHACQDLPTACYSPNDWEWLTLIVCTCAQSCTQASVDHSTNPSGETRQWVVIEEATILQYET